MNKRLTPVILAIFQLLITLQLAQANDAEITGESYDELFAAHHMAVEVIKEGTRCSFNPGEDEEFYFCSLYSAFDKSKVQEGTFYYSQVNITHQSQTIEEEFNDAANVDITFTASIEQENLDKLSETVPMYDNWFKDKQISNLTIYPVFVNTSHQLGADNDLEFPNFAKRNWYTGECTDPEACNEVTIENLNFTSWKSTGKFSAGENDFEANLFFLVNDQRQSYISSMNWTWAAEKFWFNPPTHWKELNLNMDPIKIEAVLRNRNHVDKQIIQKKTWYIDAASQWLAIPIYNIDSAITSQRYNSYGMLAHLGSFMLAAFSILVHILRRVCGGMKVTMKYTEIVKKFQDGAKHLELFPQDDELNINKTPGEDKDDENQKLLVDDIPNNSAFESVEMKRVSEHDTEEDISEESHYIEDEEGVITRTIIKKIKQSAAPKDLPNQIFIRSEIDDRSNTFKDGLSGNNSRKHFDIDGISEKTLDGKKVKNRIKKSYLGEQEEMCEEPPEFISESGIGNYGDIMNRSIEPRMSLQKSQLLDGKLNLNLSVVDDRQNTPTPYGQIKKGNFSNRDSAGSKVKYSSNSGLKNLTARTNELHRSQQVGSQKGLKKSRSPYAIAQRLRDPQDSKSGSRHNGRYKNDDTHTMGQLSALDHNLYIGAVGDKKLDKIDKHAIVNWRKQKKRKGKKKHMQRSNSGEINDLKKIVNLYKLYGNDNLALVNPAENPGVLQVRNRSAERRRIQKQMGYNAVNQLSQSNLHQQSAIQSKRMMINDPSSGLPFGSNSNIRIVYPNQDANLASNDYLQQNNSNQIKRDMQDTTSNIQFGVMMPNNDYQLGLPVNGAAIEQQLNTDSKKDIHVKKMWNNDNTHLVHPTNSKNKAFRGFANVVVPQQPPQQDSMLSNNPSNDRIPRYQPQSQDQDAMNFANQTSASKTSIIMGQGISQTAITQDNFSPDPNVSKLLPNELQPSKMKDLVPVMDQQRASKYHEVTGSPRVKPNYVEIDINNPVQMNQVDKQMQARKSRKNLHSPSRMQQQSMTKITNSQTNI